MKSPSFVALCFLVLSPVLQADPCRRGYQVVEHAVTTSSLNSFTVGDFNEDGRNDVVVKILYTDIFTLINRGEEVFEPRSLGRIGSSEYVFLPNAVDITGDGHLDLVARLYHSVAIYPGRGDGTFGERVDSVLTALDMWRTADVNGDGRLDWIDVDNSGVTLWLAAADGAFQKVFRDVQEEWGWEGKVFGAGDFDGDGRPDTVSVGFDDETQTLQAHFLWNEGAVVFSDQAVVLPTALRSAKLQAFDIDGDGTDEMIDVAGNTLTVVHGRGRAVTIETISLTQSLDGFTPSVVGDLDGDGRRDVILRNNSAAAILWGRASGEQTYSVSAFDLPLAPSVVADINGDRVDDVLSQSSEGISILYGARGSRDLRAAPLSPGPGPIARMLETDFDGDGRLDLITSSSDSFAYDIEILQGGSDLRFRHRATIAGQRAVGVGDLDADGHADLVTQSRADVPATSVYFGGGWTFGDQVVIATTSRFVGVAAMAGGSKAVVMNDSGAITSISLALRVPTATPLANVNPNLRTLLADVDGDGDSDVVAVNDLGAGILLTQSAAGWTSTPFSIPMFDMIQLQAADVDGDSRTDLVARSELEYGVFVARGDGTYIRTSTADTTGFLRSIQVSDVDRDGRPDVVLTSRANFTEPNMIQIHRNAGGGSMKTYGTFLVGATYDGATLLSDVDHDGWEDVIVGTFTGAIVLRNICVTPRVRVAAVPNVAREGDPIKLVVHALPSSAIGGITIRNGGAVLHMHQPNRAREFASLTFELPPLPVGQHVLTVDYTDQFAGISSISVTVHVVAPRVRRRAVR